MFDFGILDMIWIDTALLYTQHSNQIANSYPVQNERKHAKSWNTELTLGRCRKNYEFGCWKNSLEFDDWLYRQLTVPAWRFIVLGFIASNTIRGQYKRLNHVHIIIMLVSTQKVTPGLVRPTIPTA